MNFIICSFSWWVGKKGELLRCLFTRPDYKKAGVCMYIICEIKGLIYVVNDMTPWSILIENIQFVLQANIKTMSEHSQ